MSGAVDEEHLSDEELLDQEGPALEVHGLVNALSLIHI